VATLADPIRIGEKLKLKNRFVTAPMYRCFGVEDGYVRQEYVDSYAAEARGGAALVCVANTAVSASGVAFRRLPRIDDDKYVAGLGDVAYAIHLADCKAAIQLFHGGMICRPEYIGGQPPVTPSALPLLGGGKTRALTDGEIEQIIEDFGQGARRAQEAGYDAVNVHACHGGLVHEFMSPLYNKREDKWGMDRTLFARRVIQSIREHTDPDFPIIWRFSAEEYSGVDGYDFDHALNTLVPAFLEAGVDCLDVSAGSVMNVVALAHLDPPVYFRPGILVDYAAEVKKRFPRVPVITVGKLNDPRMTEDIIRSGKADLVALGRQVIADPDYPRKVLTDQHDDVRRCLSCNWCLLTAFWQMQAVKCAVNPGYGKERDYYEIRKAARPKRIMVAGGGPAGMEFARVATLRGHEVVLYEKQDRLGGLVNLASSFPHLRTHDLRNIVTYLRGQLEKLGVQVHLGHEVTAALVEKEQPDVLVVATGSQPNWPNIPGVLHPMVVHYEEYLRGNATIGDRVVVVGGVEGAEVAVSLALQGKEVYFIEKSGNPTKAPYLLDPVRCQLLVEEYIPKTGVKLRLHQKVVEIGDGRVVTVDRDGRQEVYAADSVVVTCGRLPNELLKEALEGKVPELYPIGDCRQPRSIGWATHEAAHWARHV
jgi:2,4-dienoyl-CoA reductase-like NADH-dependent reductase (Old Yellow Enzyme family)/thioredoxin reductase